MKKYIACSWVFLIFFIMVLSIFAQKFLFQVNWAILSVLIIAIAILAFFLSFEKKAVSTKKITILATMATLAAVSRIPFAFIMSVQPTTFIVMITGYVFGIESGFIVGALAGLVSNLFLGQGPWTPWQMFSWGLAGASAGLLGKRSKIFHQRKFLILTFSWGFIFGWIMNIWHWLAFIYPLNWTTFVATYMVSFPFDILHACGNIIFSIIFGTTFYEILIRFKRKTNIINLDT